MDNKEIIYNRLMTHFNNIYGVCALMGNLYSESGLEASNLQNSGNKKLNMSDYEYTLAVDSGAYANFVYDAQGYGLAQWTYWSRKKNLLDYAKSVNKSIGDLNMQLDFLIEELKSYKVVYNAIRYAKSVREASDIIVLHYERPANQSESNLIRRASYGEAYLKEFNLNEDNTFFIYIVKKGDTLWSIAKRYYKSGFKYHEIMKDNSLKSTTIEIGQILKIRR